MGGVIARENTRVFTADHIPQGVEELVASIADLCVSAMKVHPMSTLDRMMAVDIHLVRTTRGRARERGCVNGFAQATIGGQEKTLILHLGDETNGVLRSLKPFPPHCCCLHDTGLWRVVKLSVIEKPFISPLLTQLRQKFLRSLRGQEGLSGYRIFREEGEDRYEGGRQVRVQVSDGDSEGLSLAFKGVA